jgi:hypothetical protein
MAGRKHIIAIFEGEPAGFDPGEWPLFNQGKLLAIAAAHAIRRTCGDRGNGDRRAPVALGDGKRSISEIEVQD